MCYLYNQNSNKNGVEVLQSRRERSGNHCAAGKRAGAGGEHITSHRLGGLPDLKAAVIVFIGKSKYRILPVEH
jgi:hypothetical protein